MPSNKPFVFVLMPFSSEFDDIYRYGIKRVCESLGCYCERVDEQVFHETILDRIYNQISKADILIADMSGRNPNVFYEVGYAHGAGRKTILLTQKSDDIPFDLKHFHHIVYDGQIGILENQLKRRVQWIIDNPERKDELLVSPLEVLLGPQRIDGNADARLAWGDAGGRAYGSVSRFTIVIRNSADKIVRREKFGVSIEIPSFLASFSIVDKRSREVTLHSDRKLYEIEDEFDLRPGGFVKIVFQFGIREPLAECEGKLIIRLLSDTGPIANNIIIVCRK